MNLNGIGSILGIATQLLGGSASPLGALGSLATQALGAGQSQTEGASDPLSAIMALTKEVDGIAQSGLGCGLLGSIAGMLA